MVLPSARAGASAKRPSFRCATVPPLAALLLRLRLFASPAALLPSATAAICCSATAADAAGLLAAAALAQGAPAKSKVTRSFLAASAAALSSSIFLEN